MRTLRDLIRRSTCRFRTNTGLSNSRRSSRNASVSGQQPAPAVYLYLSAQWTIRRGLNPKIGYAYRVVYVADNDLALGKLIDLFLA